MEYLEKLTEYLKENNDISYYNTIRSLIKKRVFEMDNSIPKLLNKAFNHRYTISRIVKAKKEGKKGIAGKVPDYEAQLEDQYRQIHVIQEKIHAMKKEYQQLKKAIIVVGLLNNCHFEVNSLSENIKEDSLEKDQKDISLKYLFNVKYEQDLINSYAAGLKKEGLEVWGIQSLDDIKPGIKN